jgi:hypothetical protein
MSSNMQAKFETIVMKYEVQMCSRRRWLEGGPRYPTEIEALEGKRRLETMSGRTIRCRVVEVK